MNILGHLKTISEHRFEVMKNCFQVGLYYQGLTHDLSKFSPEEFIPGVIFYQGNRSPNNAEREVKGQSGAWMHHKGRNKHHYEYWTDYSADRALRGKMVGMIMPRKYIAEMVCDRIAASKTYNKSNYNEAFPLCYLMQGIDTITMHEVTKNDLVFLLNMLKQKGEKETFRYMRYEYLRGSRVEQMDIDKIKAENPIPEIMSK